MSACLAWKGFVKVPCFHKLKIVQTLFLKRMDFYNLEHTSYESFQWQPLWSLPSCSLNENERADLNLFGLF